LATGKSASFIAWKVASSSESKLTVTRSRPAAFKAFAYPLEGGAVGGEREVDAGSAARSNRHQPVDVPCAAGGSPPVSRTFSVPAAWKRRARRTISSNVRTSACGRNG
jgi:hypothetical protein